ncbi:MAG: hypothetical protein ISR58_22125 [Anaerolineales bacterium]|nr:hypothetical protein [Chloroflexota bacterium]MBL6983892.1 hypothetical protein [Anaerolineales bacterium]
MRKITNEDILYILAFLLALGVRLINLGDAALSETEAGLALQAFDLARGDLIMPAPQPGYLALTSMLFSLFGSSEAAARFWPALAGGLLVIAPFAFKRVLGRKSALILAFGLALDPGLVALSRQADGRMLAIGFSVLALALVYDRKPAAAGIFTGLALLSGPSIWFGLLGMGIAWGAARLVGISLGVRLFDDDQTTMEPASGSLGVLQTWIIFTFGTLLIIGTRFFTFPSGLGAWASSISTFVRDWAQPSGIPVARLIIAILVYQPLALIFAVVAVVRDWHYRKNLLLSLGIWALAALVLPLAFSGRQVGDVAWALVPLWVLGAVGLLDYFDEDAKNLVSLGQAAALFVLLSLVWLTLAGLHLTVVDAIRLRLLVVLGIFVLAVLTTALVSLGWNWMIARNGAVLGVSAALVGYGISVMLGLSQVHANNPAELWGVPPRTGQADLVAGTLRDLSLTHTGDVHAVDIVSLIDSPALRWILRYYPNAEFVASYDSDNIPAVVIAPMGSENQAWSAAYRGQDFSWWLYPGWEGILPEAWVDWLVFRKAPVQSEHILIWARSDLFPDDGVPEDESTGSIEEIIDIEK